MSYLYGDTVLIHNVSMGADRRRKSTKGAPAKDADDEVDNRGRPGKFDKAQKAWFLRNDPFYDAKVSPFNGKDTDDPDLGTFVDLTWKVFETEFQSAIDKSLFTIEDWEKVRSRRLTRTAELTHHQHMCRHSEPDTRIDTTTPSRGKHRSSILSQSFDSSMHPLRTPITTS